MVLLVDKKYPGMQKGLGNLPSPIYYQTRSAINYDIKINSLEVTKSQEESPYKPDPVLLREIIIHLDL